MAARKKNSAAVNGAILGVAVGIPAIFVFAVFGTNMLLNKAPLILLAVVAIAIAVYNGMTCGLLYEYCEVDEPKLSYIPCWGELYLMDSKYLKIGTPLYILAIVFFGLSRLPYSTVSFLGENVALSFPFYMIVLAMLMLFIIQIVKGIGILGCVKMVAGEWQSQMHGSLGFIKSFGWLGFIPFVRVMAVYGLNKPLSTLVTFSNTTISDNDDVVLEEEEDGE